MRGDGWPGLVGLVFAQPTWNEKPPQIHEESAELRDASVFEGGGEKQDVREAVSHKRGETEVGDNASQMKNRHRTSQMEV